MAQRRRSRKTNSRKASIQRWNEAESYKIFHVITPGTSTTPQKSFALSLQKNAIICLDYMEDAKLPRASCLDPVLCPVHQQGHPVLLGLTPNSVQTQSIGQRRS